MSYFKRIKKDAIKKSFLSEDQILELAVRVIVNPTYGWITTALIIYGCRPIETFSLIPSSDGTASVVHFGESRIEPFRRKVLANPSDFVEKLNIVDQVSQPFFFENLEDYDFVALDDFMINWNIWFKSIQNNLELSDLGKCWARRIINSGISKKLAAKYMGIPFHEFCSEFK
tara:strand:+ start:4310 stop:4825 length:516 start_codon:yes stop_codon:yes gene_type:complete